jgi:hypothetical protein
MFFSISKDSNSRFPNNYQVGNLWVNCDNGWQLTPDGFYKGYADNYCRLVITDTSIQIEHSQYRSFPLWYQDGVVTNIEPKAHQAWTDDAISIDQQGHVTSSKIDIDLTIPAEKITTLEALDRIRQRLDLKLSQVPKNIKLFCSGGLDTMMLYSMLAGRHSFELVTDEHYEHDEFTDRNQELLDKFWAYNQIHHWTNPTWLATGSHGDEYFLRGPTVIGMLTAWHDINFSELLADNPDAYHYRYFNKDPDVWKTAWDNRYQLRKEYPTVELLHRQIMNILVNDYQHWHLGNTLTWTPFKDIEIARILLQLNIIDLIPQFIDGRLSKDLIIDYNDNAIDYLSQYKNYNKHENILKLYEYHRKLTS